ncbi:hypothetical protein JCM33774_68730 [Actinophytocola sp. KF-1]
MSNSGDRANDQGTAGSWIELSREQKGLDSLNVPFPEPMTLAEGATGPVSLDTSATDSSPAGNAIDYDG